jgi:hypothetical protein
MCDLRFESYHANLVTDKSGGTIMKSTQAVKMKGELVQRGLEIAKERKLTHGQGVELAVLEARGLSLPESEETISKQGLQQTTATFKQKEREENAPVTNGGQDLSLVSLDNAPVQAEVSNLSESYPRNLELEYVHALANQALELGIATSRQVIRDLSNRAEGLSLPESAQLQTYLDELKKQNLHPKVLERVVSVISERTPINEVKVLPKADNSKALMDGKR